MEYVIRTISRDDLGRLAVLCADHAEYEGAAFNPPGFTTRIAAALFSAPPELYGYMVMLGDQAVGYFSYTFDYSTWDAGEFLYLDCLYLDAPHRGKGVGRLIMEMLKDIGRERGCVNVQWQTPSSNEAGIAFYRKMGASGKHKVRFFLDCL